VQLRVDVAGPAPDAVEYALQCGDEFVPPTPLRAPECLTRPFLPGEGVLVVRAKGHGWRAVRFDAADGAVTTVAIVLPPAGAVEGTIARLPPGDRWRARVTPADDLYARLRAEGSSLASGISRAGVGGFEWWTKVGNDGRFRIQNLTPGRWQVRIGHQPDGPGWIDLATKDIEIRPGATTTVELLGPE
jgi:hypothetical protein